MNAMTEMQMTQILQAITGTTSGNTTLKINNTPQCPHKMSRPTLSPASTTVPMNIDQPNWANRSPHTNIPASQANHTYDGSTVMAGKCK